MLSDEPCWGQSVLQAAVGGLGVGFQCSPTSRVGVNNRVRQRLADGFERFSALRRAVLGSIFPSSKAKPTTAIVSVLSDEPCWGQLSLRKAANRSRRRFSALRRAVLGSIQGGHDRRSVVGGFSALRRAVLGSIDRDEVGLGERPGVSVLSDEPCWGQYVGVLPKSGISSSFSALRRAVLGSMRWLHRAAGLQRVVSVLSDEPCWGQSCPRRDHLSHGQEFQCSPTSRVGVNTW